MLVFTRKEDDAIRLVTSDGVITITVVKTGTTYIKLGIDAPLSVTVRREDNQKALA